jgi:hypothetical protein
MKYNCDWRVEWVYAYDFEEWHVSTQFVPTVKKVDHTHE